MAAPLKPKSCEGGEGSPAMPEIREESENVSDFVEVAAVGDVPAGSGRVVEVHRKEIALFNVDGRFYALENSCPHLGGPLGEGSLEGPIVTCPWHRWKFDVITGRNADDATCVQPRYSVAVHGSTVYVNPQSR